MTARLEILVTALCGGLLAFPVATNSEELGLDGLAAGLAPLRCVFEDPASTRAARGAIVDTGVEDASFEIILTAGHWVPLDRERVAQGCFVLGEEDEPYAITSISIPEARGRGAVDDWAVLTVARRFQTDVRRLRMALVEDPSLQETVSDGVPARLPLRTFETERRCEVIVRGLTPQDVAAGLFAHDCVAWRGHSGSPILIEVDGEPLLLGIHLGERWVLAERKAVEIARYLDATIVAAIEEAAAAAAEN